MSISPSLCKMYFSQEVEVGNTTADSGVSSLPVTDSGSEESQAPQEKAPVRFGWVTGVMVSKACVYLSVNTVCKKTWTKESYAAYFNCFNP